MKSLLGKFGFILIGLAIFGYAEVWGADWKLYVSGDYGLDYYDAQSITHSSKNIVRVWIRTNYTEKGVIDMVGKFGKKYENLSHSIDLYEMNCIKKMFRLLSGIAYDKKGRMVYSYGSPTEWDFIASESRGEILHEEICK